MRLTTFFSVRRTRILRDSAIALAIVGLWIVATVPSGFPVTELSMFAGPGIVLAIAASWGAHAFRSTQWNWDDALYAACVGAALFPPIVGFFIAWASTFSRNVMIVLLVVASWVAPLGGVIIGAVGRVAKRPRTSASSAHLELLE